MTLRTFYLFLLSATLATADLQSEYEEFTRKQDNQIIQSYFEETDPLKIELTWDLFLGKALLIMEKGKQRAIQAAGYNRYQVEAIKRVWNSVQEGGVNGQYEVRRIIDNLRFEALHKAPVEWNEVARLSMQLWSIFKRASATGNPYEVKAALTLCTNSFRQADAQMRRILASRYG